jgi:transposase
MIGPRAGTLVWLAAGVTDMRCGIDSLAAKVQMALAEDPFSGHVFAFRGRRGELVKLLWSDGDGICLLTKRLERGRFVWPQADSGMTLPLLLALHSHSVTRLCLAGPRASFSQTASG